MGEGGGGGVCNTFLADLIFYCFYQGVGLRPEWNWNWKEDGKWAMFAPGL